MKNKIDLSVIGGQVPSGAVPVSGAKNAATRLMAAGLLTNEPVILSNFPTELVDVAQKARFMRAIGAELDFDRQRSVLTVNARGTQDAPPADFDFPIRTTYLLPVGQLVRYGHAHIPYPGGCKLGERKYDLHLEVWRQLGCDVVEREDHIEITARSGSLVGNEINFPITTVGGTENALLCGAVAQGTTVVHNAYVTPEVYNLIELLRLMGAQIQIQGSSMITIEGAGGCLHGATIDVIPDRIEALTWIIYAALSKGDILIENVPFDLMEIPLQHLRAAGLDYFSNSRSVYISPNCFSTHFVQPFELACGTHPGIISDMQPFYVLLAMFGAGKSLIVDYRYPKRVAFLDELLKFAPGSLEWKSEDAAMIRVNGPVPLRGAQVKSTDLRGSMTLVMAGLLAQGKSIIHDVGMALRGYNLMEQKLRSLGIEFEISE